MIIRILTNKGFEAFKYNENKITKGQAEVVTTENLKASTLGLAGKLTSSQCYDILRYQDGLRSDAKSTQIHITISSHERDDDKERLTACAKEYMEKMGYGDQPYIVYFHKDTRNNHVHIVSTRVKLDRTIISDSNEKKRSAVICREFNHRYGHSLADNVQQQFRLDSAQALQWAFADKKSFAQLMETMGYKSKKIRLTDKSLVFIKDGSICGKVTLEELQPNMKRYADGISFRKNKDLDKADRSPIFTRKQLIYTKLTGYNKKGFTLGEIERLEELRKQLGIKLHIILRTDAKDKQHIAWMCQDFAGKTFFKGSDIMNLDSFSLQMDAEVKKEFYSSVNAELMYDNDKNLLPWRVARKRLREVGYELIMYKGRARVRVVGTNALFDIPADMTKAMLRAQRIADVKALPIHSVAEGRVLAMLNYVSYKEITPEQFAPVDPVARAESANIINSILANSPEDISGKLKEEKISVIASGQELYFLDEKKTMLFSTDELGIPLTLNDIESDKIKFISMDYLSANYGKWTQLGEENEMKQMQEESQVLSTKVPYNPDSENEELMDRSRKGEEPLGAHENYIGNAQTRTSQSVGLFDILMDLCMGFGQNLASYQSGAHNSKKDRKRKEQGER